MLRKNTIVFNENSTECLSMTKWIFVQSFCPQEGAVTSDIDLRGGQAVGKWLHQQTSGKVEDQSKSDGDGEGWQSLPEDGQK